MKETIIFCVPGSKFTDKFMKSWTDTLIYCIKEDINIVIKWQRGSDVFQLRNKCFGGEPRFGHLQKPFQGKINYDYIVMFDSDQVWSIKDFKSTLETMRNNPEINALTGVYPRVTDNDSETSTIYKIFNNDKIDLSYRLLNYSEIKSLPKLSKVDGAGLGFCIIRKNSIEKITYPWFEPIPVKDSKLNIIIQYTAEDIAFWIKLKKAGIDLWCDTSLYVGHEKNRVFILEESI